MNKTTLLIAAGICSLAAAASSQAQTGPAPIAWYKFDEAASASSAVNSVAGGASGTIGSEVTTGVAGISGNAYSFGGTNAANNVVNMGDAAFLDLLTTQLTISAWVKTSDTTGNRNTVVSAGSTVDYRSYSDIGVSGTTAGHLGEATARNRPAGAGDASAQATGTFSDGTVVNNNAWHQIVMTVNTTTSQIILYVDGVQKTTQTMTTSLLPVFDYFQVGRLTRDNNTSPTGSTIQNIDPYQGLIDDVQVYNSALTGTQISWLHSNPGQALTAVPEPSAYAWAVAALCGTFIVIRRRAARLGSQA